MEAAPKGLRKALLSQPQLKEFSPLATVPFRSWKLRIPGKYFLSEDGASEDKKLFPLSRFRHTCLKKKKSQNIIFYNSKYIVSEIDFSRPSGNLSQAQNIFPQGTGLQMNYWNLSLPIFLRFPGSSNGK